MLRLLGRGTRLCDGMTRREVLQAGAISSLGLTLPGLLQAETETAAGGPAKVEFKSAARGAIRCNSNVEFDGNITLNFEPYELPATCMVTIDGKRGVFQVYGSGRVTCNPSGNLVSCSPTEVK